VKKIVQSVLTGGFSGDPLHTQQSLNGLKKGSIGCPEYYIHNMHQNLPTKEKVIPVNKPA
jgi:hypothetical protein